MICYDKSAFFQNCIVQFFLIKIVHHFFKYHRACNSVRNVYYACIKGVLEWAGGF